MSRHTCSPSRSAASSNRAASAIVDATAPDVPAMSSTRIRTSSAWSDAMRSVVAARSIAASGSVGPPAPACSTMRSTPSASHARTVEPASARDLATNSLFGDAMFTR